MPFSFDTTYKDLDSKLYSTAKPKDVDDPEVLVFNQNLCSDLGLNGEDLNDQVLSGQDLLEEPIAQAYAGHQFGTYTLLGDGRAMILGEHVHDGSEPPRGQVVRDAERLVITEIKDFRTTPRLPVG